MTINANKSCTSCLLTGDTVSCISTCETEFKESRLKESAKILLKSIGRSANGDATIVIKDEPIVMEDNDGYEDDVDDSYIEDAINRMKSILDDVTTKAKDMPVEEKTMDDLIKTLSVDEVSEISEKLKEEYVAESKKKLKEWYADLGTVKTKTEMARKWLEKFTDDDWFHQANAQLRLLKDVPSYVDGIDKEGIGGTSRRRNPKYVTNQFELLTPKFINSSRSYLEGAKSKWDATKKVKPIYFTAMDMGNNQSYWDFIDQLNESYERFDNLLDPLWDSMIADFAERRMKKDRRFVWTEKMMKGDLKNAVVRQFREKWGVKGDDPAELAWGNLEVINDERKRRGLEKVNIFG